jgi:hypothetical protein
MLFDSAIRRRMCATWAGVALEPVSLGTRDFDMTVT